MLKGVIFAVATFLVQALAIILTRWLDISFPQAALPITPFTPHANYTEIFFYLLGLFFIGIWVWDLWKSSLMHTNLKFVCYLISFHIFVANILGIVLIIDKFNHGNHMPSETRLIIESIYGFARTQFTLDPSAAALERGLATLKVSHYEKFASPKYWFALMFLKEIIGIIATYLLTYTNIGAIAFAIFWVCLLCFTVIVGIILYRMNLRSYKTRIGTLHLTTRYQTVENIRCLKPVLIYSFLAVIQNIIAFVIILMLFIRISIGDYYGVSNLESLVNLIVAISCSIYPLSFLAYSSRIRKLIKYKLKFYRKSRVSSSTAPVLSVMGKVLTSKNEQNIYFTQLKTAWK